MSSREVFIFASTLCTVWLRSHFSIADNTLKVTRARPTPLRYRRIIVTSSSSLNRNITKSENSEVIVLLYFVMLSSCHRRLHRCTVTLDKKKQNEVKEQWNYSFLMFWNCRSVEETEVSETINNVCSIKSCWKGQVSLSGSLTTVFLLFFYDFSLCIYFFTIIGGMHNSLSSSSSSHPLLSLLRRRPFRVHFHLSSFSTTVIGLPYPC